MHLTTSDRDEIVRDLADCFRGDPSVRRVVVFGSFWTSQDPHDVDVAIFQDTDEPYLPLAMRYRRLTRPIAERIALDIIPIRSGATSGGFLDEVQLGRVILEQ
jgi:uncharacterized protein